MKIAMSVLLVLLLATTLVCQSFAVGTFTGASVHLTWLRPANADTYEVKVTTTTDAARKAWKFTWLTEAIGGWAPAGLAMNSPTLLGLSPNLGQPYVNWQPNFVNVPQANGGYATMTNPSQGRIPAGQTVTIKLAGIVNPTITLKAVGNPGATSSGYLDSANGDLHTGKIYLNVKSYDDVAMMPVNLIDEVTIPVWIVSEGYRTDQGNFIVTKVITQPANPSDGAYFIAQREDIPYGVKVWVNNDYNPVVGDKVHVVGALNNYFGHHTIVAATVDRLAQNVELPKPYGVSGQGLLATLTQKPTSLSGGDIGSSLYCVRVTVYGNPCPLQGGLLENSNGNFLGYLDDGSGITRLDAPDYHRGVRCLTASQSLAQTLMLSPHATATGPADFDQQPYPYDNGLHPSLWLDKVGN